MYLKERIIISLAWLICFIAIWFIPKNKFREASSIFLFTHLFAWIFGLLAVEAGFIVYPVRLFWKANATSFSFEYLVFPFLCIFFNLYFPKSKSLYKRLLYYISILTIFTLMEIIVEKYTQMLNYVHWEWYNTFISMFIIIYFIRVMYKWYFKLEKPLSL